MDNIIKERLTESIIIVDFSESKKILDSLPKQFQSNVLLTSAYHAENLSFYCFILSILLENETGYWHSIASQMFMVPLCFINGSDALAIYHIKQAIKFDTTDVEYKQGLLMYYNHNPEPFLSKEEAMQIINEILALDPENSHALDALADCNKNKIREIVVNKSDFSSLLYYGRFEEARELFKDLTLAQIF